MREIFNIMFRFARDVCPNFSIYVFRDVVDLLARVMAVKTHRDNRRFSIFLTNREDREILLNHINEFWLLWLVQDVQAMEDKSIQKILIDGRRMYLKHVEALLDE